MLSKAKGLSGLTEAGQEDAVGVSLSSSLLIPLEFVADTCRGQTSDCCRDPWGWRVEMVTFPPVQGGIYENEKVNFRDFDSI